MSKNTVLNQGIPISPSLNPTLKSENIKRKDIVHKKRLFYISLLAILIAISISFIAKGLIHLIDFITNISFYGKFSIDPSTPMDNQLGWLVVFIPAIGGLLIGLMAYYGSKAIRGHGIPEAMEQILTNQSKVNPAITYLKPLSAAISIGTGGPFGAEGPIISTGGALGSTLGQLLKITHIERKILLAAGATAGMSAIFGTPIAAIFLAIELLLFEFSPRSIIPVALACVTGAIGHHFLFEAGVVFPASHFIEIASISSIGFYAAMGIVIGFLSIFVSKLVYWVEEGFEKLPIHWAWWPAIGGLAVGFIGYYSPRTLGVGYHNIVELLSGSLALPVLMSLFLLKFTSWAISLGSGTSGGTLAPLLTIGGAFGSLLGTVILYWFPDSGVTITLAALVGMSALFAGASRALLTSIVFALEATGQFNALLPLLATCLTAYLISYFFMKNTIMTERIARRGVKTPSTYEPDNLEKINVSQVLSDQGITISEDIPLGEVQEWLSQQEDYKSNYYIISDSDGKYKGIISSSSLFSNHHLPEKTVGSLVKRVAIFIELEDTLRTAAEKMVNENVDVLPVVSPINQTVIGILSYHDILASYKQGMDEHDTHQPNISLKRKGMKILIRGQKLASSIRRKEK
ncbi:MAG: chloride channel protein [Crocinitomicaceae bacterium]|nr:chloride channel protein [Crocinitomicaceae bacterium]